MSLEIIRDPEILQHRTLELKRTGKTIAVVPTMGALHTGHRTLIAEGRRRADILIVSIFVNPTQFAPNEDLDKYPRTFDADAEMCRAEGVDFIFFPTNDAMYPTGYATYVEVENLGATLCGLTRPTHFRGVTTVCTKLFLITQADFAIFGWKDAQQQIIIRRMVNDLNIPVEIIGVETVREPDGLALSSRNKYLTPEDRIDAVVLSRALSAARALVLQQAETCAKRIREEIITRIEQQSHGVVDYVCVVAQNTLQPLDVIEPGNTLIALAVWWGATRLIDNIRL
ncbi:TPA: pantoate--beta-alanine ligase [Candidatus Sumerlaeota bacterium]|jgi:pantoate--beta-alanine ligase|nr:pantoate--beta-alanine ligase [Candidatus Sumerlaeota bacterium]